jgi:hypothetical protein
MGWEGDKIITQPGTWKLFDEHQADLGIITVWWGPPNPARYINAWRVHTMPLPTNTTMVFTDNYGAIDGDNLAQRRDSFQSIWIAYRDGVGYDTQQQGIVWREWTGYMKEGLGFALNGASSAWYQPPSGPTRDPDDQI